MYEAMYRAHPAAERACPPGEGTKHTHREKRSCMRIDEQYGDCQYSCKEQGEQREYPHRVYFLSITDSGRYLS